MIGDLVPKLESSKIINAAHQIRLYFQVKSVGTNPWLFKKKCSEDANNDGLQSVSTALYQMCHFLFT